MCALGVTPGSQNDADAMGVWMGGSSGERLNHEKSEVGEKSILPPSLSWTFSVSLHRRFSVAGRHGSATTHGAEAAGNLTVRSEMEVSIV